MNNTIKNNLTKIKNTNNYSIIQPLKQDNIILLDIYETHSIENAQINIIEETPVNIVDDIEEENNIDENKNNIIENNIIEDIDIYENNSDYYSSDEEFKINIVEIFNIKVETIPKIIPKTMPKIMPKIIPKHIKHTNILVDKNNIRRAIPR